jgi:hypothetical protein
MESPRLAETQQKLDDAVGQHEEAKHALAWLESEGRRRGPFLDWIYRFLPSPKLGKPNGASTTPRFGLGP